MNSLAWKDMKMSQRALYVEFKKKFTKYSCGDTNQNDISLPKSEASQLYGDLRTFRFNVDALIEHGFIRCIQSGYTNRTSSIYGFSDKWKRYGKPEFNIPKQDKRPRACRLGEPRDNLQKDPH